MATGSHADVPGSLDDLERKLEDLERQLGSLWPAGSAAGAAPPPPPPPPPPPAPQAGVGVDELRSEISELVRFRDQLEAAANELMAEHDRLLERLKSMERAAGPASAPGPAATAAAPPAPAATPPDTLAFEGPLVVDAGPFADLSTLAAFEQSLAGIEGAEAVAVRSFVGSRALIDMRLSHRVALVDALRQRSALGVIPREAPPGRLVLDVATGNSHLR